jgi:hypothetical protein
VKLAKPLQESKDTDQTNWRQCSIGFESIGIFQGFGRSNKPRNKQKGATGATLSMMTSTPHIPASSSSSSSSLPQCHWRIRFLLGLLALTSLPTNTMALAGFGTPFFAYPSDSTNSGSRSSRSSTNGIEDSQRPIKVLVTGAAGKTGRLVLKKLEQDPRYDPKALVRSEASARSLIKDPEISCPLEHIAISDITSPTFAEDLPSGLDNGYFYNDNYLGGRERSRGSTPAAAAASAMIICTSAVPQITRRSLAAALVKVPWNVIRRQKQMIDYRSLKFKWKHNGYPEKVDYHGTVAQINLAKKLGIQKVILMSSMGGTDPSCFLNNVGKNKDGTGHGDILQWKRKAEKYLVEVRETSKVFCFGAMTGCRSM